MTYDYTVVGAGLVGLATAYKLSLKFPEAHIAVVEKETGPAQHQSGRNSGVIHAGVYYKPGSQKAVSCTSGRVQLLSFACEHNIPHEICGKLILAVSPEEAVKLPELKSRAEQNGLAGIEEISASEIEKYEPYARGEAALFVPHTGIANYVALAQKMAELFLMANPQNRIFYGFSLLGIENEKGHKILLSQDGKKLESGFAVFCGGLNSDRLSRLDNLDAAVKILPFRGDYYQLSAKAQHKVKNLIYPVPDARLPFLGVHFTRMIGGGVECGPNAVFSLKREGYKKTDIDFADSWDSLTYSGTWKLFARYFEYGVKEFTRSVSKPLFLQALQRMMPSLKAGEIEPARAGVRAQAVDKNGNLVDDFLFQKGINSLHVLNAPSPAATACLSIADTVLAQMDDKL